MKTIDFEQELKNIDENLTVIDNPNNKGLKNIMYKGKDVCPIPAEEIKDEPDRNYVFTFENGMIARHNSKEEALAKVKYVLNLVKTEEGSDLFFDK